MVLKKTLARLITTKIYFYRGKKHKMKENHVGCQRRVREQPGYLKTIKAKFDDFFRGSINNFGWQIVPRFDNADRKCKLAACSK